LCAAIERFVERADDTEWGGAAFAHIAAIAEPEDDDAKLAWAGAIARRIRTLASAGLDEAAALARTYAEVEDERVQRNAACALLAVLDVETARPILERIEDRASLFAWHED
jgi:hypothetical protein